MRTTPIRYDKRFNKIVKVIMIIDFILLFVFTFAMLFFIDKRFSDINPAWDIIIVIVVMAEYLGAPLLFIAGVLYIDSLVYLKRLEKNHFLVPEKKSDYQNDLSLIPRTEVVENKYAGDSKWIFLLFIIVYGLCVIFDILYLVKWHPLESDSIALFIMLMLAHLIFVVLAFVYRRQRDTYRYIDSVDIKDDRKVRMSLIGGIVLIIILGGIATFSIMMAHSMTKYIYKSRYGPYEKTLDDLKENATMTVTSGSLYGEVWDVRITNTDAGENLSPQLTFDEVEGAEYYYIYMVDESANYWVHWLATDVHETTLKEGANLSDYKGDDTFKYIGPYPPPGSGDHTYTIFVYAMKGKPDSELEIDFDETCFSPDYLYYDYLTISKKGDPNVYGNVLAFGYISGKFGR